MIFFTLVLFLAEHARGEFALGQYIEDPPRPCHPQTVRVQIQLGAFACVCFRNLAGETVRYGPFCSLVKGPGVALITQSLFGALEPLKLLRTTVQCLFFYYGDNCERFCSNAMQTCGPFGLCDPSTGHCICQRPDSYGPLCGKYCTAFFTCSNISPCDQAGDCAYLTPPSPVVCPSGFFGPPACTTACARGTVPMTSAEYVGSFGTLAYDFCHRVTGVRVLCADPFKVPDFATATSIVTAFGPGSSIDPYHINRNISGPLLPTFGGGDFVENTCVCDPNWYGSMCNRYCNPSDCGVLTLIRQPVNATWCLGHPAGCLPSATVALPQPCSPDDSGTCLFSSGFLDFTPFFPSIATEMLLMFNAVDQPLLDAYNRATSRCNGALVPIQRGFKLHDGPSEINSTERNDAIFLRFRDICTQALAYRSTMATALGGVPSSSLTVSTCLTETYEEFRSQWLTRGTTPQHGGIPTVPYNFTFYNQDFARRQANGGVYDNKLPLFFGIFGLWQVNENIAGGPTCDRLCIRSTCGANGRCDVNANCICTPGFFGAQCFCGPNVCLNGGTCDPRGWCTCLPGWGGDHCERAIPFTCPLNLYQANPGDLDCTVYCNRYVTCSGHGSCSVRGVCECDAGHFQADCSRFCTPELCNNRGTCSPADGSCLCTAVTTPREIFNLMLTKKSVFRTGLPWKGLNCDCVDPLCGPRGVCSLGPGVCECTDPEYFTDRTVSPVAGYCDKRCWSRCTQGNQGLCDSNSGKCQCKFDPANNETFKGEFCDFSYACGPFGAYDEDLFRCDCPRGLALPNCRAACTEDCGDGTCNEVNTAPRCLCPPGYSGDRCQTFCTPEKCNFDFENNPSRCNPDGTCACAPGFAPPDCRYRCTDTRNACGPNGQCNPDLSKFECLCDAGWVGDNCDIRCSDAVHCNGGGTCRRDGSGCDCLPNFGGQFCDRFQPPCICVPGHGDCTSTGKCLCISDFRGERCEMTCATCTSGVCDSVTGDCLCDFGTDPITGQCVNARTFNSSSDNDPPVISDPGCLNVTCPGNSTCDQGLCLCDFRRYPQGDCSLVCPTSMTLDGQACTDSLGPILVFSAVSILSALICLCIIL